MTVIIATDVFGNTPALASLVRSLGHECLIVSPYDDDDNARSNYRSEQIAYQAFIAQGGLARYIDTLDRAIREHAEKPSREPCIAIGFSAGASALWMLAATETAHRIHQMILFYGSRIRDYTHLRPVCPARLIFAAREAAFDPFQLVQQLRRQAQSAELVTNTAHGFMNPYSGGFCVKTQARFLKELALLLQQAHHCALAA
ncbi:dienelactone hydrolase family protein [Undibacterium sp. Jales W-56]|uniref:dienelactone hydrolase family protein n=1 Tax=Undibacterium sp. Jales W-56 TaxID=2897325 RepID=UPI0021CFF5AA|nr:dienelactone hydrolase family protein [Undibacterium sp. Jales W-56]MCU6432500.1 dienelactone hydrolase family protein [Undibacterium sp. Jales W-56]